MLRIEDTDKKREVEDGVSGIVKGLEAFGVTPDEGVTGFDCENGKYGPYTQSHRREIYRTFAKKLMEEGKAYPCFCTEEDLAKMREQQEAEKANPGYYGKWAAHRDMPLEEVEKALAEGKAWVLRFRSEGDAEKYLHLNDLVKGKIDMPENDQDIVLLKSDGIPTYHFAHVVDDHLMQTTHVVRGAEWLPSLPIHIELFEKLGWEPPVYCHTAQLMKLDEEGNKRKLSKRKDPELSLDYYRNQGYHPAAVREYLMTILNSNFEEWRIANPDADIDEFEFTTEKMSTSGALFDLNKLNDISKDVLLKISASDLYDFLKGWAAEFRPEIMHMFDDRAYLERILDIGRKEAKPRKDHIYAQQMVDNISYFFDDMFKIEDSFPA